MERGGGEQDGGGVQQRDRESTRTTVADRTQRFLSVLPLMCKCAKFNAVQSLLLVEISVHWNLTWNMENLQ